MRPPEVFGTSRSDIALTLDEIVATAQSIAAVQQLSGAIPWPDGHVDAWNHTECAMALTVASRYQPALEEPARRAYAWLRRTQRADGSWSMKTRGGVAIEPAADSNQSAYVAVGAWHRLLVTDSHDVAVEMWPTVRRAIDFVVDLQTVRGEIVWERRSNGTPGDHALLTGCSSTYHSLRCAVALGEHLGEPQPDWELAADQLGHVIADHPEAFADKSRYSMDWYYPILGGAVRGQTAHRRLAARWHEFVVPQLGVRCVTDQPWVTGAETCELALALHAVGDSERAGELFRWMQHLRAVDGAYWTGYQFGADTFFPAERSSWTAAAVVLTADALGNLTGGADIFRTPRERSARPTAAEPVGCGCEQTRQTDVAGLH